MKKEEEDFKKPKINLILYVSITLVLYWTLKLDLKPLDTLIVP